MTVRRIRYRVLEDGTGIVLFGKRTQTIRATLYKTVQWLNSDQSEQAYRPAEHGPVGSLVQGWDDIETLITDLEVLLVRLTIKAAQEGPIVCPLEGTDETLKFEEGDLDSMSWQIGDARRFLWKAGFVNNP